METQRQRAMETREAYCQKYDAEIKQWEAKRQGLKAEAQKCSADAKLACTPHIQNADTAMKTAKAKWAHLTAAAEDKWEEFKGDAEEAWMDVKAKLEGAYDAMKKHKAN